MNIRLLIVCVMGCCFTGAFSQSLQDEDWDNVLETLLSDEDLSSSSREELTVMYESMHAMPLNINTATREELSRLPFLSDEQIEDIQAYVYLHGPMLTLGELQLTGSLDWRTRQLLRFFVFAGDIPVKKEKLKIGDVLHYGRSVLVGRMDIPLYLRDGFRYHSPDELERYPNRAYIGNRLSHSLRYSFNWKDRIRFGISVDKDAGEPFLSSRSVGYDYWSPYLYIRDMGPVHEFVMGNFKAQFGLGLLLGGGFSTGKSMAVSSLERISQGLKPHSSTQEYGFLQGAGMTLGWGRTCMTLLAASTPLDATLKGDSVIGSFKEDGYHRTELEWSKKHNVTLNTFAVNFRYSYRGTHYGITAMTEKLSVPYKERKRFKGFSADCSLHRPHYVFSAEVSVIDSRPSFLALQTFRLQKGWNISSVFRLYSPDYLALHSNALAEGSVQNETGILTGFTKNDRNLKLSGYIDLFMHPEPKYGVSERSNGMELRMETDWQIGMSDNLFATARFKSKQKDCKYTGKLEYCITGRYRLRWTHKCRNGNEIKTQLYYTRYDFIAEPISNGWALTQSYSGKMFNDRLVVNLSSVLFFTDNYDSSVSVYENGLRYAYNFISLYGKGARMSATVKYQFNHSLELSLKACGTRYLDRKEISSAQQRIASNHKEDISVQFITKF